MKKRFHIGTGDDRKTYNFDDGKLLNVEWMAIEEVTGRAAAEILESLRKASMISVTAIVWILRRREEPGLQFEDVEFQTDELQVDDPEEPTVPKEEDPEDPPAPN